MLRRRQSERSPRRLGELRAAFAVTLCRPLHLGNALADDRFGDDQLRFPRLGLFGLVKSLQDRREIVPIDGLHLPPNRFKTERRTLALGAVRHGVERDVV